MGTSSDFNNLLANYINNWAVSQIVWHSGSNPGSSYINTGALAGKSYPVRSANKSGTMVAADVIESVRANAQACASIRRVRAARIRSGDSGATIEMGTRVASLKSSYALSIGDVYSESGKIYQIVRKDHPTDISDLTDFIKAVQGRLSTIINSSAVVDLSVCHDSCHDSCHGSRSRR